MKFLRSLYSFFLVLCLFVICDAFKPMCSVCQLRLKKVISSAFPATDLITAHYGVLGYSLLKEKAPEGLCKFLESKMDKKKIDTIYFASSTGVLLSNCKLPTTGLQSVLDAVITEDSSMQDVKYAVLSLKHLKLKVDSAKVAKVVKAILKKDDSVINLANSLQIGTALTLDEATKLFERIEDVIVQADEVDGKYLQFEGGLGITAETIKGVFQIAETMNKAPALTQEQALKFLNYFLSRKYVQTVKGAAQLLEIVKIFTTNKFYVPVSVTLSSDVGVSSQDPNVRVKITNALGESLGPFSVTLSSAKSKEGDIKMNKAFNAVSGNSLEYTVAFYSKTLKPGFYTLSIDAVPKKADARLIGNSKAEVVVKAMTEVAVENAEIGTSYVDQVSSAKSINLEYPKESVRLEADSHQTIFMRFALKDKQSGNNFRLHQVFVMFVCQKSGLEVVYVAEPDQNGVYKFDLDVKAKEKDFSISASGDSKQGVSAVYDIKLIVGDPVILNPFIWKIGQVTLTFPGAAATTAKSQDPFAPKPEIKHMFREKEKTPPSVVSNTFSALCIAPLLLLLILWFQLGANLKNFPCSIYAVGFHAGLLSIFLLFVCFWVHLNMFSTLKYLIGLGTLTFLSGHKLLSKLAGAKH